MAANPQDFAYFSRGESPPWNKGIGATTGFDYFNRGEPYPAGISSFATLTAAAALTGTGSLTAAATRKTPAAATLTGTGTLTAAATRKAVAAAALTGTGTLTAAALRTGLATAALTGAGTLHATATVPGGEVEAPGPFRRPALARRTEAHTRLRYRLIIFGWGETHHAQALNPIIATIGGRAEHGHPQVVAARYTTQATSDYQHTGRLNCHIGQGVGDIPDPDEWLIYS